MIENKAYFHTVHTKYNNPLRAYIKLIIIFDYNSLGNYMAIGAPFTIDHYDIEFFISLIYFLFLYILADISFLLFMHIHSKT